MFCKRLYFTFLQIKNILIPFKPFYGYQSTDIPRVNPASNIPKVQADRYPSQNEILILEVQQYTRIHSARIRMHPPNPPLYFCSPCHNSAKVHLWTKSSHGTWATFQPLISKLKTYTKMKTFLFVQHITTQQTLVPTLKINRSPTDKKAY